MSMKICPAARRTLRVLRLRSDQTDIVFGCSHISQPVLAHLACCPQLRRLGISSAELMSVDLGALRHLIHLEVGGTCAPHLLLLQTQCEHEFIAFGCTGLPSPATLLRAMWACWVPGDSIYPMPISLLAWGRLIAGG